MSSLQDIANEIEKDCSNDEKSKLYTKEFFICANNLKDLGALKKVGNAIQLPITQAELINDEKIL